MGKVPKPVKAWLLVEFDEDEVNDQGSLCIHKKDAEDEMREFGELAPEFYLCEVTIKPVERISATFKREKL